VKNANLLSFLFFFACTFMVVFTSFEADHKEQIMQLFFKNLVTFNSGTCVNRLKMMMTFNSATQPVFIMDLMMSVAMFLSYNRLIDLIHIFICYHYRTPLSLLNVFVYNCSYHQSHEIHCALVMTIHVTAR